jgi:hypothetical protein
VKSGVSPGNRQTGASAAGRLLPKYSYPFGSSPHGPQRRARLDAELAGEHPLGLGIRGPGFEGAARAAQRAREHLPQVLTQRVLGEPEPQLRDQRRVVPETQPHFKTLSDRDRARLLQSE